MTEEQVKAAQERLDWVHPMIQANFIQRYLSDFADDHRVALAALRRVRHVLGMMERSDSESAGWWEQQLRSALDGP